jgi:membrane dipeptidase
MIVDISHVADKTFWDALETSKAPIFDSHSSCRALSPVPRDMTDDMIAAMAKKGGVIQINFDCGYLNPAAAKAEAARMEKLRPMMAELRKKYEGDPDGMRKMFREMRKTIPPDPNVHATLADVVKHINHVSEIAGVDAVGLGSDFDGVQCVPEGLDSVEKWPNLTRALLEEGYTAAEIRKTYGENTLRLMAEVERVAKSLR